MKIQVIPVGPLATNCYLLGDEKTGECAIIDPGAQAERKIFPALEEFGMKCTKILLTHGHFDHVMALRDVKDKTGAEICIHKNDAPMLTEEYQSTWKALAARGYRQALADTNSYLLESLRGLRDILQYQNTAARAEGIAAHSETLGEKQKAMKYREGVTVGAANTLIVLTALAVLGVSIRLYQNGQLGAEGVLVCTLSALSSFGPVVALANLGASLTQVFASADRVLDLLDEDPVTADVTNGVDTAFTGAQAEHVSFAYAREEVLHDLSLTIPEKKIVGITGRSGSGKSTFLRLLMRFWDVSSGTIRFGERDIRAVNTAALRAQESLVTQETELFDDTIENNIRIARRDATRAEVEAACRKAALDGFINSLPKGYDTPVGELGGALSGGERQRIGVARAFLHDAPFLLLDEPTSNLDSLNEGIILKAVRDECREKTVLLVSHRRSTMAVADLSFSVESGRLS